MTTNVHTRPSVLRAGRRAAVAALAAALLAAPGLRAQESGDDPRRERMVELQEVNRQLAEIRQRALQDPELREEQAAVQEEVIAAMTEIDPETGKKLDRMERLQAELRSAREEGDAQQMGSLLREQRTLQASLQQAQGRALERPDVAARVASFRESLIAAMKTVDPKAERLLERQQELQAELLEPGG